MEKQVENNIQKVFVKINQVWKKGEAVSLNDTMFKVKTADNLTFEIEKNSKYLEIQKFPEQKFAIGEAKERLEGAYISFDKLEPNVQDTIVKGREYLISTAQPKDGVLQESVRMVQLVYSPTSGSRMDVQIKRKEIVTISDAKAYQHQFTKEEYNSMVTDRKNVVFTGTALNGETFQKLAYYEPKLNDIRTKPAVSANMYALGQQLTEVQAETMNKGEEVKITIQKTKKGPLTYMVSWSPKTETFKYKSMEKAKTQEVGTKQLKTVGDLKKKQQPSASISL
jgi:hypothetical protein